jgi:predicted nuclease with TOPRIM domain
MSTTTAIRRTAVDLRSEYAELQHRLDVANRRWDSLRDDDTLLAFEQRPDLRASIRRLENRLAELPGAIERADKYEGAVASLRGKYDEIQPGAERLLSESLDGLERLAREPLIHLLTTCAAANQVRGILAASDRTADLPRPFDARRALLNVIDHLRHVVMSIRPEALRPDPRLWAAELAILNDTETGGIDGRP